MKRMTMLVLFMFIISISMVTFAYQHAQVNPQERDIATETAEEGKLMEVVRTLPSTLITDEEHSKVMKEVEELKEGYRYDEDLSE